MKISFLCACLALCALSMNSHAQPVNVLSQADKSFNEKSYARALELYRRAQKTGQVREPERVNFQIASALFKTERWNEALASAQNGVRTALGKARFHYLIGQIYVKIPHTAWKVGGKTLRQDEYPAPKNGETPQRVYLEEEDQTSALQNLETAKIEAQVERVNAHRNRYFAPIYPLGWNEECDLNLDLAGFLPQASLDDFQKSLEKRGAAKFDETVDAGATYSRGWSLPKKVLFLYREIASIDQGKDKAKTQRALLGEGLFLRSYKQRMEAWATADLRPPMPSSAPEVAPIGVALENNAATIQDAVLTAPPKTKPKKRAYPFANLNPNTPLRTLVARFPRSPLAPQTLTLIAGNQPTLAAQRTVWRDLLQKYPKSKWASDARAAIRDIERREVSFSLAKATRPGQKPRLELQTRNAKSIEFTAYRVKLENFLLAPKRLRDPNTSFTSFSANFGSLHNASKWGAPVARWRFGTKDKGDYNARTAQLFAPLSQIGAYVVVASAGKTRFGQVVVVSDLALLKKSDGKGVFAWVCNAKTGAKVSGARVVMKEVWEAEPRNKTSIARGTSNAAGFFDKKRAGDSDSEFSAFAFVGNRYAFTGDQGRVWYGNAAMEPKVLGYTDRPVYRPSQKVAFRFLISKPSQGNERKPVVKHSFFVQASDARGAKLWEGKATTNEFGSLSGSFSLPEGVTLGVCKLDVADKKQNLISGGGIGNVGSVSDDEEIPATMIAGQCQFRVEEYKRPEFEVTVSAPTDARKPGETVEAKLSARYYFGAPVPNAKVKYTVRKSTWWADFHFPTRYDWLLTDWGMNEYGNRRNIGGEGTGEIVAEGTTTTDSKGNAQLSFATKALEKVSEEDPNNWWQRNSNPLYTIEAEITDASRRTIEAQGQVKVARQPYFAFLNTERGYFQKGDRVPVEVRTQDANDLPVAASGVMRVFRLLAANKEAKVLEQPVQTDASGRAVWTWQAPKSGQFRVEFEGQSEWGDKPRASQELWIVGEQIGAIRLRGVSILLDKAAYEEGQTIRARLVADRPGANVLLTQEANGQILRRDVVHIPGQSTLVSIPIERKHVPNFFLGAALVQDFEVYQAQTEVVVPPTRQLLNLEVKGDKAVYKPGETGTFQIRARDWSGKPARAEVSLALVDASLFSVQSDTTADVRSFFYGDRRANSVNLDSSRSGQIEARTEAAPEPSIARHGWELPDDFGQLQLTPGGFEYSEYDGRYSSSAGSNSTASMAVSAPSPASPVVPARRKERRARLPAMVVNGSAILAQPQSPAATSIPVRSNFAETAFWSPAVVTKGGAATVKVTFPDSLTQWHATARGLTSAVQVGSAESDARTKKDLIVRLQAPRFFVEGDEVMISANVHNYSDKEQNVRIKISAQDLTVPGTKAGGFGGFGNFGRNGADDRQSRLLQFPEVEVVGAVAATPDGDQIDARRDSRIETRRIKPGEESLINWRAMVGGSGQVAVQVAAQSLDSNDKPVPRDSDAVKMTFPVLTHGAPVFNAHSGVLSGDATTKIHLTFPKQRQMGATRLNVQLNPSLAATALDALPYLADYPYGCVEQTMSRFLPTVLVERSLKQSGVNLETLRARANAYGAQGKAGSVQARVKNSGYTFPQGEPNARDLKEMSSQLGFTSRRKNPIFDARQVAKMTREGLSRLASMQRGDGGWGWFPGAPESDVYMSAYVVYGLSQAKLAGVLNNGEMLNKGRAYLQKQLKGEDNLQLDCYITYALSQLQLDGATKKLAVGRLFTQRERLVPLSKAYLAMTLFRCGEKTKAQVIVHNLENTVRIDVQNGTARYQIQPSYWLWWNNDVETAALALRAFDQIEPNNKLVPMLAKWLTLNSRGNHWRSTKETAEVVYTLADYVAKHRELDVDYTLQLNLNGKLAKTYHVTADNALWFDNRFRADDSVLESGDKPNTLTMRKVGRGKLYFSAYEESFSREEPLHSSGNELEVNRKFYRLTRADEPKTPATDQNMDGAARSAPPHSAPTALEYTREEIKDQAKVKSGDLIEVELVVNAKNDYEYLLFEDMKAAGFEPVDVRSGYDSSDSLSYYVEMRDDKTAFFVENLPQGKRVLRYRVRAEVPGTFHALPTNGYAMYAPEVRATSDELRVGVGE
jgi:uncharacterized protein YfaS (alpha-2-macroglobulin family)